MASTSKVVSNIASYSRTVKYRNSVAESTELATLTTGYWLLAILTTELPNSSIYNMVHYSAVE